VKEFQLYLAAQETRKYHYIHYISASKPMNLVTTWTTSGFRNTTFWQWKR